MYTEKQWRGAIASIGRLVDVRNFPAAAAEMLLGKRPVSLGQPRSLPAQRLDPEVIGAVVFWTKGAPDFLVEQSGLREVLETYKRLKAVVGLQLSVTGWGGTFVEPGIPTVEQVAQGLEKVLATGLIDVDAVQLRYDPLLRIRAPNGRLLGNDTPQAFEKVARPFAGLSLKYVKTKFFLLGNDTHGKYRHVRERMRAFHVIPLAAGNNLLRTYARLVDVARKHNMMLSSCCVRTEQNRPAWPHDQGCLSAARLTAVGKKLFGPSWQRLSQAPRPSRRGCLCSQYFDFSRLKGHRKCGSGDSACIYCTACNRIFGNRLRERFAFEMKAFCEGRREEAYAHLLNAS